MYLGNLPYMTDRGTFIINGAERVIVSQLHRSPGVFFGESVHPNGTPIFSARIIPFRGSWVEFTTDINNVMYAYIDRKKKFPVTTLLRALGYSSDDEILELFGLVEEVKLADIDLKQYRRPHHLRRHRRQKNGRDHHQQGCDAQRRDDQEDQEGGSEEDPFL